MLTVIWQRLDQGARHILPFITAVIFLLASVVAWPLPYIGTVAPSLALVAVYYWAVHRPDLFGPGAACILGLLYDAVNFLPMGLSALVFVAVYQLVLSQRRFLAGHSFFMLWSGFALAMAVAILCHWLVLCVLGWRWIAFLPVLVQGLLTIVIFPLPAWLLIQLQRLTFSQG